MTDDISPEDVARVEEARWRAHEERHEREEKALADSTLRLETQVAAAASRLESQVEKTRVALSELADLHAKNHDREHANHERIHAVEKDALRRLDRRTG